MAQITESGRHTGISNTPKGNTYLTQHQSHCNTASAPILYIVKIWDGGDIDYKLKTLKNVSSKYLLTLCLTNWILDKS